MTRRTLLALMALFSLAAAPRLSRAQEGATVVIIVRHGEKDALPANDPPLTEAGKARAKALVDVLANVKLGAVFSTATVRTEETVRPTAKAQGGPLEHNDGRTPGAQGAAVLEAVKKHPGQTILVAGHSNTVMAMVAALGGPKLPDLCDGQYSKLLTVIVDQGKSRLIMGSYGAIVDSCGNSMR